jgi:transcription elongation factor GreA
VTESFLTPDGAARLRAELVHLTTVKRDEIAVRLREAKLMGDLSENADWIMAKEDQAFLEGRILELEAVLRNATIVAAGPPEGGDGIVSVGATVTVEVLDEDGAPPEKYVLVGAKEADPRNGRISNESPIGRALLGRRAGDTVKAETPGGKLKLKITRVEH